MTILTSISGEKKPDNTPSPDVVSDYALLINGKKKEKASPSVLVNVQHTPVAFRRQHRVTWLALLGLLLVILLMLSSICLYKNMIATQAYKFACGVKYHEVMTPDQQPMIGDGKFEEDIEVDTEKDYEKISVPTFADASRATIIHDFNVNYTAIIDKDEGNCFLLPLDRSMVLPPRDFFDLLMKMESGYYVPDTNVIREKYRVITPPLTDLTEMGIFIKAECQEFDSFKLVKDGEPIAMSKRSVCSFKGKRFCLGQAGFDKMLCLMINDCV